MGPARLEGDVLRLSRFVRSLAQRLRTQHGVGFVLLTCVIAGCSLVVGGEPTPICESDEGCPSKQRCVISRGVCIDADDACTESGCDDGYTCDARTLECVADDEPDPEQDAEPEPDADSGPVDPPDTRPQIPKIGVSCSNQARCALVDVGAAEPVVGVCALKTLTGFDVPSFCSVGCCSTNDCPSGYFCQHGPNAGRYCVPFDDKTRPKPSGDKAPGEECVEDTECATGRCAVDYGTHKICFDSCCSDEDCGDDLVCGLYKGGANKPLEWVCKEPRGPLGHGAECDVDGDCKSAACLGETDGLCTRSCCSNAECFAVNSQAQCTAASDSSSNTYRTYICDVSNVGANVGSTCSVNGDCKSDICVGGRCAAACCTNSDCPAGQGCVADGNEPRPHCTL